MIWLVSKMGQDFKTDISSLISKIEKRSDEQDDRIFWLATGKRLQDAILEEKIKNEEKKEK